MQLVHVFENHEHTVCTSKEITHVHAQEIDCDMCFCHLSKAFLTDTTLETPLLNIAIISSGKTYNFLPNHQQLSFSLRGPPVVS